MEVFLGIVKSIQELVGKCFWWFDEPVWVKIFRSIPPTVALFCKTLM